MPISKLQPTPQAVIFDMDGVIIDSEPIHDIAYKKIVDEYVRKGEEVPSTGIGKSTLDLYHNMLKYSDSQITAQELTDRHFADTLELLLEKDIQANRGLIELLTELRKREIHIGLASSSVRSFVLGVLNHLNIRDYFEVIICGDDGYPIKPAPDLYQAAAAGLKLQPEKAIAIEDSETGASAAIAAHIPCFGLTTSCSSIKGTVAMLERIDDVLKYL